MWIEQDSYSANIEDCQYKSDNLIDRGLGEKF